MAASVDKTRLDDGEKGSIAESSTSTSVSSILQMDYEKDDDIVELPAPASSSPSKPKMKLSAAAIIPVWMILSSGVIIYNNYLYNTLEFKFPVFLVTWHLIFAVRSDFVGPSYSSEPVVAVDWNAGFKENNTPPGCRR